MGGNQRKSERQCATQSAKAIEVIKEAEKEMEVVKAVEEVMAVVRAGW